MDRRKVNGNSIHCGCNRNHEEQKKKPPLKGNVTQLKGKRNEVSVTKTPATVACKSIRKSHSLSAQFYEMHGQAPSS